LQANKEKHKDTKEARKDTKEISEK
jgi:hypothetical protein